MDHPDPGESDSFQGRLESAMAVADVAWWEFDVDTGGVRFNDHGARMLGYAPERFTRYEEFAELVHPDDRERVTAAMTAHLDGTTDSYDVEHRVRTADDDYRWFHHVGRVTGRDADGNPTQVTGIATDVTDRKEHDRKLDLLRRRSQALMHTQTKVETAQVATDVAHEVIGAPLGGVHLLSDDGERLELRAMVETVTEAFEELPSYAKDAASGSRAAVVWEVFESGEPLCIDDTDAYEPLCEETPAGSVLVHPIGRHGVLIAAATEPGVYDETDRALVEILANSLTTAMDRVERERRLRDRERGLERLHEATRALIQAETPRDVAELTATAAEEILGFSIVLIRFFEERAGGLVPVAASDSVEGVLPKRTVFTPEGGSLNWEAYESGEPRLYDDVREIERAVDSGTALRSLFVVPLGEYGTLAAGETIPDAFDETDVFLARILATAAETALEAGDRESELRRQRDELARQNERLDEFASVVSHDLRNPLNIIEGSLELAEETGDAEHVERARRAADRMETLIEDILTLSKAGEQVADLEPVAVAPLVERCWDTVDTTGASLTVDVDVTVRADESRLTQLMENLLRNAVEHGSTNPGSQARRNAVEHGSTGRETGDGDVAEDGGAAVQVTVGSLADGFYVADDGPGIPPAERERVFERGYSTRPDGTGFGLNIVRQIVEAHGWEVDVTESRDGGARFEITGVELVE